jgi:haloalkane dehalogenase
VKLVESGVVSAEDLDIACKLGFGHPMGPLATTDLTGVDVLLHATKNIYTDTADEKFFPPELLQRMVTAGDLGRKTGQGFYTYDRHVESIARFAAELDLRNITLVVQDWGGPIGFRFAVENPERIARLVVLNTGIGARAPNEEWLRFQAFVRRVGTDIVPGQLIRISLVQPVDDAVIAAYDAPFPTPESKTGTVMFPELVATSSDHPSAPAMLDVRDRLRTWEAPALVLFSDSDPIFSRRAAEAMAALLPNAELAPPVEGAGHFLQEDRGERISADVSAFVSRTS